MEEVTQTIPNTAASRMPTYREKHVLCRSNMGDIVASAPCFGKAVIPNAAILKTDAGFV